MILTQNVKNHYFIKDAPRKMLHKSVFKFSVRLNLGHFMIKKRFDNYFIKDAPRKMLHKSVFKFSVRLNLGHFMIKKRFDIFLRNLIRGPLIRNFPSQPGGQTQRYTMGRGQLNHFFVFCSFFGFSSDLFFYVFDPFWGSRAIFVGSIRQISFFCIFWYSLDPGGPQNDPKTTKKGSEQQAKNLNIRKYVFCSGHLAGGDYVRMALFCLSCFWSPKMMF